jgi:hypothetical protein
MFALSLHASIPTANSAAAGKYSTDLPLQSRSTLAHSRTVLTLTATPASVSFYDEFYSPQAKLPNLGQDRSLHWFASLIKKRLKMASLELRRERFATVVHVPRKRLSAQFYLLVLVVSQHPSQ